MLKYVPFYTNIWEDKNFRTLSVEASLLFIYLFGNSHITLTGIYEVDIRDSKVARKLNSKFEPAFQEIINKEMVNWDEEKEIIFVKNRFKLIPNKNSKMIQGVISELNIITHPFKEDFIKLYNSYFGSYKPILKEFADEQVELLNIEQIKAWQKLGWQKQRIKKFYMDRGYSEHQLDEFLGQYFANII